MYLSIYVDDILLACNKNITYINKVKALFCNNFDMTDEGELQHFSNVRVRQTSSFIQLDQVMYA